MEFTGKVIGAARDYSTGKYSITFEVNEGYAMQHGYDKIKELPKLSVKAVRFTGRRSLDANAYFHVLVGKIAEALVISKVRCKNILIGRYGQQEFLDDKQPCILKSNIPVEKMLEQEFLHCVPFKTRQENGIDLVFYKVYRGSHTYDTREMSCLIDGTVAEAKEMGIETATPDEIRMMKERWGT